MILCQEKEVSVSSIEHNPLFQRKKLLNFMVWKKMNCMKMFRMTVEIKKILNLIAQLNVWKNI